MKKFIKRVGLELRENRSSFLVFCTLRALVIVVMILQLFNKNYENVFLCFLTMVLMILPSVIQATLKIEFPSTLEIIIFCFIFSAEILGEISAFYIRFTHWDTVLHTLNGFLCAAIGFSLVEILNRQKWKKFDLSPIFMTIVAFCFSMTIGVLWEFLEFGMDSFFGLDMQKDTIITSIHSTLLDPTHQNVCYNIDNIKNVMVNGQKLEINGYLDVGLRDTMKDLLVNFVGAIVFSVMGYFLLKNKTEKSLIDNFVLEPSTKSSEEKEEEQLQIKEKAEKERKRRREIRKLKKM